MILRKDFYLNDTVEIAQKILGSFLLRRIDGQIIRTKIVEVEAYAGFDDKASHASKGLTPRTKTMFMQGGVAYVYLVYGMHNMLNVVTGEKNYPSALLIRALEPLDENLKDRKIYSGPGKLSKALGIDRGMNGKTVYTKKNNLWIESGDSLSQDDICRAKRIGVDYAGASKELEWRFYIKNNPFVSDYKKNKS